MDQPRPRRRFVLHGIVVTTVFLVGLAVVWAVYGRSMAEKVATRLVVPTGIVWVCLLGACYFAVIGRRWALAGWLVVVTGGYTVFGSTAAGEWAIGGLEAGYRSATAERGGVFEYVVVLGGGTMLRPDGGAQLSFAGDRVMEAARLYRAGRVEHLVTTGEMYDWGVGASAGSRSLAEMTAQIWQELGVPESAITRLGGRNTAEEMGEIRELLREKDAARVGLLTSAWHLPRAERLAAAAGLKVEPVAADFATGQPEPFPLNWVPSYFGFARWDNAVTERLAGLVGR